MCRNICYFLKENDRSNNVFDAFNVSAETMAQRNWLKTRNMYISHNSIFVEGGGNTDVGHRIFHWIVCLCSIIAISMMTRFFLLIIIDRRYWLCNYSISLPHLIVWLGKLRNWMAFSNTTTVVEYLIRLALYIGSFLRMRYGYTDEQK